MERKRLAEQPAPRPELSLVGNRERLRRSLRSRNHIDAAALAGRPRLSGDAS